jgi:methionyl-tRNA formyltransferase
VRAYNPGNICYAFFREKRINIYKTRLSDQTSNLESGTLIKLDKKTIGFIAGDRKILILEEVQPENKKVMSGLDFLNGIQLKEGEKLL